MAWIRIKEEEEDEEKTGCCSLLANMNEKRG